MPRPRSSSTASEGPEPGVGSQVHVTDDEGQELVGTVTSADHGWFTVALTGQAQVRKCRRAEIQVIGESERAMPATTMATVAEKDEEEEKEEEEAIIRLDGSAAAKKSPPPVTQLQRDAARLASARLETGLPKPSYLRFDKLGNGSSSGGSKHAKRARLDPTATRALLPLPPQTALLPPLPSQQQGKKEQGGRQTQAHHKDKEAEQDAKMILMRNYIDPKRFYKNLDSLTPGFQIGTVIEGRMETGPQGRLSRKQRKRTFVDEILADRGVRKYSKRKFSEIQAAAQSGRKGWQKKQQRKHQPKWARG